MLHVEIDEVFLREKDVQSWPEYVFHALKVKVTFLIRALIDCLRFSSAFAHRHYMGYNNIL